MLLRVLTGEASCLILDRDAAVGLVSFEPWSLSRGFALVRADFAFAGVAFGVVRCGGVVAAGAEFGRKLTFDPRPLAGVPGARNAVGALALEK